MSACDSATRGLVEPVGDENELWMPDVAAVAAAALTEAEHGHTHGGVAHTCAEVAAGIAKHRKPAIPGSIR